MLHQTPWNLHNFSVNLGVLLGEPSALRKPLPSPQSFMESGGTQKPVEEGKTGTLGSWQSRRPGENRQQGMELYCVPLEGFSETGAFRVLIQGLGPRDWCLEFMIQ